MITPLVQCQNQKLEQGCMVITQIDLKQLQMGVHLVFLLSDIKGTV